jgi:hypothetical protein
MHTRHLALLLIGIASITACKSEQEVKAETARNFQMAVIYGDYQAVNRLLGEGVDLKLEGNGALLTAAKNGNLPIAQLLIGPGR